MVRKIQNQELYGGNEIRYFDTGVIGKQLFANSPYEYYLYAAKEAETIRVDGLTSYTVYAYKNSEPIVVKAEDVRYSLDEGDTFQSENNSEVEVSLPKGAKVLIAGTSETKITDSSTNLTKHADIKKVTKPWGHELWINGDHPNYALKQIFIKLGTKTSLQYHRFKRETNVLVSGTARLHFKSNSDKKNDSVETNDIGTADLEPVSAIDVMPECLHRLEAMTDVLLYEVSTPFLDDVVRVSDDTARADGRINSEHS